MSVSVDIQNDKDEGVLKKYALVLVEIKALGTKTFSYLVSDELKPKIKVGQAVLVPFGRMRPIKGFVVGFSDYLPEEIRAKYILKILDEVPLFDVEYLKFLEWVSNYYCCEIQDVIETAIPMRFLNETKTVKAKLEKWVEFKHKDGATSRQLKILEVLESLGESELIRFEKNNGTTRATMNKLAEQGLIEIFEKSVYRDTLSSYDTVGKAQLFRLSDEQEKIYQAIAKKLDSTEKEPILLYGVTASGKTEIYFKAMKKVIDEGKNVLFLAPEIALASQLTQRVVKQFHSNQTAIWHSSISDGERFDVWQKLKKDEIKILIGARSCVFAPLKNIGLIIIDEEHESSYKQTMPAPRYDARVVAKKLAKLNDAVLVLGSATPDVVDFYEANNSGNLLKLEKRFNDAPLANVVTIDMRDEFYKQNQSIISRKLIDALKNNLENKKQSIILINRRGFSTSMQCQACGFVMNCENCAIPMIYHKSTDSLKCHYCGSEKQVPRTCPDCDSEAFKGLGLGTQRIEGMVEKLFPDARIARVDSDILTKKNAHIGLLKSFNDGEIDILIGTQMIAKGLDNPNVTLVAAINADMSFNLPDYKASERGFSLLTQLAGRSGRSENLGRVYFQTYNPDFYALATAQKQDYISFYENEIKDREEFDYPPFSKIIRVVISSKNQVRAEKSTMEIEMRLSQIVDKRNLAEYLIVLGPTPCVLERLHEEYRFQILIKNKLQEKGHRIICSFLKSVILPRDIKIVVDVDPVDIL